MSLPKKTLEILARHKKALLISFGVYVVAVGLLIVCSRGPQTEPFLYQIN
jgi:hypothetical protein